MRSLLPQRLAAEVVHWRTLTAWPGDRDFIFPNTKGAASCITRTLRRACWHPSGSSLG
jgi:hypothetical protein